MMLQYILLTANILVCIALVLVVLAQRSEGGALGMGGGPSGFMSVRGAGDFLTRTTWGLFAAFLILSLAMTWVSRSGTSAVADRLRGQHLDPASMTQQFGPGATNSATSPATTPAPGLLPGSAPPAPGVPLNLPTSPIGAQPLPTAPAAQAPVLAPVPAAPAPVAARPTTRPAAQRPTAPAATPPAASAPASEPTPVIQVPPPAPAPAEPAPATP